MSTRLKEYYGELEQKVEEKTKELSRKVLDLEDSKKAMMNLLEDLEESKKLLEKKINESERLNKVMIGRELRVIELKKKVKELGGKLDD